MSVQGTTLGRSAPWRLMTMRLVAHIMSPGRLSRIAQQRVVISGTSWPPSISGSSTSCVPLCGSIGQPLSAIRRA